MKHVVLASLLALFLGACGGGLQDSDSSALSAFEGKYTECVPYARAASGVKIYGDAWTWWDKASGKYERGNTPRPGAVLSFGKSSKLSKGHVAVVVSTQDPRKVLLTHANWGNDGQTRGVVHHRQPAVDVSPNNDWTQVRLMNTQGTLGSVYPARGFIYPNQQLARSN